MALCPAGHDSQTSDYCDTCGAVMGGAPVRPAAESAASGPAVSGTGVSGSGTSAPSETGAGAAAGGSCPQCGAERGGRFCEECGFDYELAELVPPTLTPAASSTPQGPAASSAAQNPDPFAETLAMPPDYDFDAEFEKAEREFAASGSATEAGQAPVPPVSGRASAQSVSAATGAVTAATAAGASPAPPRRLTAVVIADPEYYAAQIERGDIVEADFPFPKYPGERRFPLDGDRIRIGRASASRGIAVEIDLTGPPLDPAVSHLHAQLLRAADGSWSLVDLDSANGTRLNGAEEPLPAETEVPVGPGDRIHLGVWTTLVLEGA